MTYVRPSDAELLARSHAVIKGRVLDVYTTVALDGSIETVSVVAIDEVMKGKELPPVITILRADEKPWQHYPGVVLDWVTPPGYSTHYQGIAWADMPAPVPPRPNYHKHHTGDEDTCPVSSTHTGL